jgi:hypothetical protein
MKNDFAKLDAQDELAALAKIRCDEVLPAQGIDDANPFNVKEMHEIEAEAREEYDTAKQAEQEMEGNLYSMTDMGRND